MSRRHYNNRNSEYGWKILSTAPGKSESAEHLYPFQWRNDFDIANGRAHCQVTADRTDISPGQHVDTPRNTDV